MRTRPLYRTKQHEILVEFLKEHAGEHVTAARICRELKARGTEIGQATVYRQLERLVDEGTVNKYIIDENSPACFEYIGPDSHSSEVCFHCKCEKCGKLIHLHCEELETIQEHLKTAHRFYLNPNRTVFYGLCESCAGETVR
ncbi:MAG: transcriptional repressor [Solobacterium sp.]|jgi:Fur family ferric uptake transcriptional regulator|nr:transcriptional repressor [Solobacterium sp.]